MEALVLHLFCVYDQEKPEDSQYVFFFFFFFPTRAGLDYGILAEFIGFIILYSAS